DLKFTSIKKISFQSKTNGDLLFKNFRLEPYVRDPAETWQFFLTEPFYRDTIFPRTDTGRIAGKIQATLPAVTAKIDIQGLKSLDVALTDGCGEFAIPAADLADGTYPVTCQLLDADGKELKNFELTLRKVPQAQHDVLFDADKNLLIDGKPFYSISEYRAHSLPLPGGRYFLARNGINTVFITSLKGSEEQMLARLDDLDKYGLKAVFEISFAGTLKPQTQERYKQMFFRHFTEKVRNHPALLAYYICDEPLWCGVDYHPLVWTKNFLQEADPYHPVWINHAPRNEVVDLIPYGDGCDITSADIYPLPVPNGHCGLPDRSLNCVGAYTRRMSSVVFDRKPIWMILQAFCWQDHNDMKTLGRRIYPTEDEMRFMFYDAYFNGNKGVSLYGTRTIKDRLYYEMVHRLLAEMRSLSGMLSQAKLGEDVAQDSNPNVRVATCTLDGKVYYGILNKEPKTNSVTFPADRNLVVYREERQLPVQDGKITTTLRPHDVLICGAAPLPPPVYSAPAYDPEQEALGNPTFDILRFENALAPDPRWSLYYHGKANWIWDK
ncbi:MAG: hypothetical protein J6866_08150, partial [Victivallales bacterium]|nr:hypothetical protein [Victivallales bacterium]